MWYIAFASVIGKGHISAKKEGSKSTVGYCQDYSDVIFSDDNKDKGVAIVSDGAGSYRYSDLGAIKTVEYLSKYLLELIDTITPENWDSVIIEGYKKTVENLEETLVNTLELPIKEFSSTVQLCVFTPTHLYFSRIGDGRSGYRQNKEWLAATSPHKGELANETVFLTSCNFGSVENKIIEATDIDSFCLMSDGCENTAFECFQEDVETGQVIDVNKPYDKFLNPNVNALKNFYKQGLSITDLNKKWAKFLDGGLESLQNEFDDKTLILAVKLF